MMDYIICLSSPNLKWTFDLHYVVYLLHTYINHIPQPRGYTLTRLNETKTREEKINIDKDITTKANLEMNQDLNILDKVFSLP
jgi:hypothetical protein